MRKNRYLGVTGRATVRNPHKPKGPALVSGACLQATACCPAGYKSAACNVGHMGRPVAGGNGKTTQHGRENRYSIRPHKPKSVGSTPTPVTITAALLENGRKKVLR